MARPIKPTHLKVVAGTAQKCRMNPNEPKPQRSRPSPPAHLSDRAKAAWGAVSLILDEMGVLTKADVFAVEGFCEAYADGQAARASLAKDAIYDGDMIAIGGALTYVTVGKSGPMLRQRPEIAMIADADRRLAMWAAKCGMTPADRARVSASPAEKQNDFAEFG
jgi:P27 family predicted phage terminase small subunit